LPLTEGPTRTVTRGGTFYKLSDKTLSAKEERFVTFAEDGEAEAGIEAGD
jgi:hypothetical protein